MSVLSKPYMHNEAAAFEHVEAMLWADGPVCPFCGVVDSAYKLEGVRSKPSKKNPEGVERHGLWKCRECRKQFTVRKGTIFEDSHIPLHLWLQAIHLMVSSKKGISSHQLHRVLGITYKSAWFLSHRIRECMRDGALAPFGGKDLSYKIFGLDYMEGEVRAQEQAAQIVPEFFVGSAIGSFDGVIEAVDLAGDAPSARLILSAGGKPVDAVLFDMDLEEVRMALGNRVRVSGRAIYNSTSPLPVRIEIRSMNRVGQASIMDLAGTMPTIPFDCWADSD